MKKVLKIEDTYYIQKAEYDKAKEDLERIKELVSLSITNLTDFISGEVTAQPLAQSTAKISKEEDSETVYSKRSKNLKLRKIGCSEYTDLRMEKDGTLYSSSNRKLTFTMKEVLAIQKEYGSSTDKKQVKKWAKELGISIDAVHRIIYNIDINFFSKYIRDYLTAVNEIEIKQYKAERQNNPQKRKEAMGIAN